MTYTAPTSNFNDTLIDSHMESLCGDSFDARCEPRLRDMEASVRPIFTSFEAYCLARWILRGMQAQGAVGCQVLVEGDSVRLWGPSGSHSLCWTNRCSSVGRIASHAINFASANEQVRHDGI